MKADETFQSMEPATGGGGGNNGGFNPEEMDAAAHSAMEELRGNVPEETIDQFADWWRKWYLKAGHKRLGRALIGKL